MNTRSRLFHIMLLSGLLVVGCDQTSDPDGSDGEALDEDVAVAVAGALSEEAGGVADQMEDLAFIASSAGLQFAAPADGGLAKLGSTGSADTVYDELTGWWTATISRSRSSFMGLFESDFQRVYQYQFLNSTGQPQRAYITQTATGADTAYVIKFKVVSGSGYHRSPIRVHYLESLTADWVITNANTPVLVINGTSSRSGRDTLTTREAVRTHVNTMNTTLTDVTKPRYRLGATRDDIQGTISGTYEAMITFSRGDLYRERNIQRSFTIELSGEEGHVGIGDRRFRIGWRRGELFGMMR